MDTLTLKIDSLSYGGAGVGRHEGIVYFVPYSCPGDILEVKITKREKRYREAEIVRIIEASNDRVDAPCRYFGSCGGCQWQHVSYPVQIENKIRELKSALSKARLSSADSLDIECTASPLEYGYRRTARFKVSYGEDGRFSAGFYKEGSNELVEIDRCLLLEQSLNDCFQSVDKNKEGLVGLDLFAEKDGSITPYYRFSERDQGADFFQVNREVNELMMGFIKAETADLGKGFSLIDLYCGDGNLSLQFADAASSITGWDYSKTAVDRGNFRAEDLNKTGCKIAYHTANIDHKWKKISAASRGSDLLILDPPRRGLKKQAEKIAALNIGRIIYISCSPPALARDLKAFEAAGYKLKNIKAFDMFPQTYHLETVSILSL